MQLIQSGVVDVVRERDIIEAKQVFGADITVHEDNIYLPEGWDEFLEQDNLLWSYVSALPDGRYIVDTKVHMLKPGWLPCIGGWHFDEIHRDRFGGLDFWKTDPDITHYFGLIDAGTNSLTEFYRGDFNWENLKQLQVNTYDDLNKVVEACRVSTPEAFERVENNCLYKFGVFDAHQGLESTGSGWRYFFRATQHSKRPVINELRTQSQVYIPERLWKYGW